jgi:hypothetical protein
MNDPRAAESEDVRRFYRPVSGAPALVTALIRPKAHSGQDA